MKIILICSIASPMQYAWSLQLSVFTPYLQSRGVSHSLISIIWLCGPISGMIIQPIVGYYSDMCATRFGRRRPFLVFGTLILCFVVCLTAFCPEIGHALGDPSDDSSKNGAKTIFIIGFWVFDVANNIIQCASRAFLADLVGDNETKATISNGLFAFFMAVGNIIGYGFISLGNLSYILPFTRTKACDLRCANLKTCFILAIIFMLIIVTIVVTFIGEEEEVSDTFKFPKLCSSKSSKFVPAETLFHHLVLSLKDLPEKMKNLLLVTALHCLGWFPFSMFSTDWMGKEVYGGDPIGDVVEKTFYNTGIWTGTLGLMLCVMVVGVVSLFIEPLIKFSGSISKFWGISSFVLAICMLMTFYVTKEAHDFRISNIELVKSPGSIPPPTHVKLSALVLFAILGFPQAVTYIIPFALTNLIAHQSRAGQGLYIGILNLAIVMPQIFYLVTGPLNSIFGGSNLPAFFLGAIGAILSGISAFLYLQT